MYKSTCVLWCYLTSILVLFLMIQRPPRSKRTDTLFPYTTLFRSDRLEVRLFVNLRRAADVEGPHRQLGAGFADRLGGDHADRLADVHRRPARPVAAIAFAADAQHRFADPRRPHLRSEARRVGKEGVSQCKFRWAPDHLKKKKQSTHKLQKSTQ